MASARRTVARENAAKKKKSLFKALKAIEEARIARLPKTEPEIPKSEPVDVETSPKPSFIESFDQKQKEIQETILLENQKNNSEILDKKPRTTVPEIDKFGTKNIFTNDPGVITNLLEKHICTVEFDRVTKPYGKRIIRCSTSPNFVPRLKGFGNYNGLIKVWEVEENRWKSFYASTVNRVSYDVEPVGVKDQEKVKEPSDAARDAIRRLDEMRTRRRLEQDK